VRETFSVNHGEERMERSVEVLAIILFGVLGLSHILQPKAWAEFFIPTIVGQQHPLKSPVPMIKRSQKH
jgi:hypothetical protein